MLVRGIMTRLALRSSSCWIAVAVACGSAQRPAPTPSAPTPTPSAPTPTPTAPTPTPTAPTPTPTAADALCANQPDPLGPWILTADQAKQRVGTGVTALASITTSKEHPVEVCGVEAENEWLAATTCGDGSHPYPGPDAVEASRAGNVGAGGRCGGIIDRYQVRCPERTYDVFIDMNLCGPGESFM
jgi:hypothetical protein